MNRLLPIASSQGFGSPYIMHLHFMVDFGSPKGQTIFLPKNSGEGKQNSCNCPNWFQNAGRNSWRDILHVGVSKIGVPQNGWFIMENPITIHFGSRRPSVRNNVSNNQAHALFFQNAFTSWVHRASFLKLCFWTTAIADHVLSPAQGAALSSNDFLSFQFMKCPWLRGKNA